MAKDMKCHLRNPNYGDRDDLFYLFQNRFIIGFGKGYLILDDETRVEFGKSEGHENAVATFDLTQCDVFVNITDVVFEDFADSVPHGYYDHEAYTIMNLYNGEYKICEVEFYIGYEHESESGAVVSVIVDGVHYPILEG